MTSMVQHKVGSALEWESVGEWESLQVEMELD